MPPPPPWLVDPARHLTLRDGRPIVLRPIRPADGDLLAEFFAGLTEREKYYFFGLEAEAARRIALEIERDPAYRLIAVGELAGREAMLGYMFLQWKLEEERAGEAHPEDIGDRALPEYGACLREGAQSSGLGRAMISHLLDSAAASGVVKARLTVHTDNSRALRLYQRAGFRLVGEFINAEQSVKQYKMEVDLQAPRAELTSDVTIVPRGRLGVGRPAASIQEAVAKALSIWPFILDRPARSGSRVIFVADLSAAAQAALLATKTGDSSEAVRTDWPSTGWIVGLDADHLLVGGTDAAAVERACRRVAESIGAGELAPTGPWAGARLVVPD